MSDAQKAAQQIMALVDEFPSEPLSFERKQLEEKLYLFICKYTEDSGNELDTAYDLGYEEGVYAGRTEAEDEYFDQIQELKEELDDVRTELADVRQQLDQAFAEGFESSV